MKSCTSRGVCYMPRSILTLNCQGHFGVIRRTFPKLDQSETDENLVPGKVCGMYMVTLYLEHVEVILRSLGVLFTKFGFNSKNRSPKRMKIWAPGVYVVCLSVLFDLKHVIVILGSFGALFPVKCTIVHDMICVY